ncbi:MAG: potassium channel protein [Chloroflexi bacterium]|nr:potassium channel protein [Chloroflexota bacterium]
MGIQPSRYSSGSFEGGFVQAARHRLLHADPTAAYARLLRGTIALILLLGFGVAGYMIIEGWPFLDALYMTAVSITTVGYDEVHPLSDGGRIFTIFVILFGVGTALYILTILVQTVVEGELAAAFGVRRMQARIDDLHDHYILCGFGRVGEEIATEFAQRDVPFVVVESDEQAIERCLMSGHLIVQGDATRDDVLQRAGIERARVLMAAADSDVGNTYITLSAKALRPSLYVVARIGQTASEQRVRRAGADRVISPYSLAGRRMALSALQPLTVDFFDLLASESDGRQLLGELIVTEDSLIANMQAHEAMRRSNSTTLLAIQHAGGDVMVGPPDTYALQPGDRLMLISNESDMEQLGRTRDATTATSSDQPKP